MGTVTEVYDYLRLFFARVGMPHCPICGRAVMPQSAQEIVDAVLGMRRKQPYPDLGAAGRARKGTYQAFLTRYARLVLCACGSMAGHIGLDDEIDLDRYKIHTIEAVVDRLVIRTARITRKTQSDRSRLTDSIETALKVGEWHRRSIRTVPLNAGGFCCFRSISLAPYHGSTIPQIEPRTFTFNTPHGACPECQGLGSRTGD